MVSLMWTTFRQYCQADWLKLLVIGWLVLSVYFPGRAGPFIADDYPNILENKGVLLSHLDADELASAWSSNTSGLFKRPLANVSFALNYFYADQKFDPLVFKLTNISIHIINSFLVFFLSSLLIAAAAPSYPAKKLAFLSTLIWALHPLQLTSVLYVVQRMNSLSCMFMLAGFLLFLKGRLQAEKPCSIWLMLAGFAFGTLFGALAKENAVLLPLLIFVTELTLLPPITVTSARVRVYSYYTVTAILPVLLAVVYLLTHPEYILNGYLSRNFTLAERIMTEARVLFYYLGLLVYPDNTQLSFAHDDFTLSKSLFQPISTLFSILGVIGLLVLAVINCLHKKAPFLSFAILWFFVGQGMESSIIPLEIIYEHRNYLPSIGIAIAVVVFLHQVLAQRVSKLILNLLYAAMVISLGLATYMRSTIWSTLEGFSYFEVRNHPTSARATSLYAHSLEQKMGPNAESYRYYLAAAQVTDLEVSTLAQVYMLLNKLLYIHDVKNDQATNITLPLRYDDPLVLDRRYMQALKALVHKEIIRRIYNKAYAMRTLVTLRLFTSCIINQEYQCKTMSSDVMEWVDAALAQLDFTDRPVLYVIKAKLSFNQGDVEQAFENVDKALELSPDRMYFYIEKADLLVHLKQFDEAEKVIKMAEARGVPNGFEAYDFKLLRQNIAVLRR
jgi:tetratricopeptide (TPR) repeat protein